MNIEPIVFFDLVIATVVLAATLGAVVHSYVKTIERFKILRKRESDIEAEAHAKAEEILEEARSKAIKIMEDTNVSHDQIKKAFEEELKVAAINSAAKLQTTSEEFLKAYQIALVDLKDKNIKIINNISKDIESSTRDELEDFKEILKKETFTSQKIVETKIEEDYQTAQKEVESYKIERLKNIEEKIYNIIQNVSKEVLGKILSLQDHEQLVIDALERAKKEEVL